MERSVRRSELNSPQSTAPSSPATDTIARLQDLDQLEYVVNTVDDARLDRQDNEGDEELEFRLFAPQPEQQQQHGGVQTVKIRSSTPEHREPAFVQPRRPDAYYFADSSHNARLNTCAVSDHDIRRLASIKWFGTAYPVKVLRLPAATQRRSLSSQQTDTAWSRLVGKTEDPSHKQKRPGKKLRIKLRTKRRAMEAKKEELKLAQEAKDAAEREKRTRKNREKKAKKRLRDKIKKADEQANLQDDDIMDAGPAD